MTQSISRLVTKFDTQNVDGDSKAKSGKVKKRWGKDDNVWFHISIGSFPKWLKDFAAGYRAGYNAVVAAQPFDPNNLDGSGLDSVVQASHIELLLCSISANSGLVRQLWSRSRRLSLRRFRYSVSRPSSPSL
jgi:hypothetical protein